MRITIQLNSAIFVRARVCVCSNCDTVQITHARAHRRCRRLIISAPSSLSNGGMSAQMIFHRHPRAMCAICFAYISCCQSCLSIGAVVQRTSTLRKRLVLNVQSNTCALPVNQNAFSESKAVELLGYGEFAVCSSGLHLKARTNSCLTQLCEIR